MRKRGNQTDQERKYQSFLGETILSVTCSLWHWDQPSLRPSFLQLPCYKGSPVQRRSQCRDCQSKRELVFPGFGICHWGKTFVVGLKDMIKGKIGLPSGSPATALSALQLGVCVWPVSPSCSAMGSSGFGELCPGLRDNTRLCRGPCGNRGSGVSCDLLFWRQHYY